MFFTTEFFVPLENIRAALSKHMGSEFLICSAFFVRCFVCRNLFSKH